jgi:signal transduction histidine kinase/sugar lactone lactonase YvrE
MKAARKTSVSQSPSANRRDLDVCPAWRAALVSALLALLAGPLLAQRLHVRNFTSDQGLPASQTWEIAQDSRGALWIGTSGGVSRFDGVGFVNFGVSDGLPDALVRTIVESPDGHLWFGTNGGIVEYDGTSFRNAANGQPFPRDEIWDSLVDSRGRLWFASQNRGLHSWDGKRFQNFGTKEGLPSDFAYALHQDRHGRLWVGTRGNGVAELDVSGEAPRVVRTLTAADGLGSGSVRAITEDASGHLYFGTRGGGVAVFDGRALSRIPALDALPFRDAYALIVNRRGELVAGNVDGAVVLCTPGANAACRAYDRRNGLQGDSVYGLLEDREGNLWIGLANGVSELVSEAFASFGPNEGLPDEAIQSVLVDRDGSLWFATYDGLAHCNFATSDAPRCTVLDDSDGLPSRSIWDVARGGDGSLWVATRGGLARMRDDGRFDVYTSRDGLPSEYVYDIFEDRDGALWLATLEGVGTVTLRDGRPLFAALPASAGLRDQQIYTTAQDHEGRIWIGTAGHGISVYHQGHIEHIGADVLGSNAVHAITVARNGDVWVGTGGAGLLRFSGAPAAPRRVTRFGAEAGFHSAKVVAIREDAAGLLWIGTSQGVEVLDLNAKRPDGPAGTVVRHLNSRHGLASSEMLTSSAMAFDAEQRIWLGFGRGVSRFDPRLEFGQRAELPLAITRITVGGKRIYRAPFTAAATAQKGSQQWLPPGGLRVDHKENELRFEYEAFYYYDPEEVRYQVRLDGFDRDWSAESALRFKEYTNVAPGRYRFQVRARVAGSEWSQVPAEFPLEVLSPIWMTWPFRAIAVLAFLFVVWAIGRFRIKRIELQNRRLEALVAVRTEEIKAYAVRLEEHAQKLEIANEDIQRADRMKSNFLATMSHELRTPLNSIIGFSDVLRTRLATRASERELQFLDNIAESGRHLLALINNVLDLAKIEAGKMDVNLETITAEDLLESVRSLAVGMAMRKRIEITIRTGDRSLAFRADPARMKQILINLVSNAIKFSPEGTPVEISADGVGAGESELGCDSVAITVKDHGIGISADELGLIFDEFEQGRDHARRDAGTGLGLAIVRKLTATHGGRVFVESRVGEGSTFRVLLPRDPKSFGVENQ